MDAGLHDYIKIFPGFIYPPRNHRFLRGTKLLTRF